MQDRRMMTAFGLVQIRGTQQYRQLFIVDQTQNDVPQLTPGQWIDAHRRLIQQQQFRRTHQGASQAQLLLHAPGELARQPLGKGRKIRHLHQLGKALPLGIRRHPVQVGIQVKVFLDAQVFIQAKFLRHVTNAGLDLLRVVRHRNT